MSPMRMTVTVVGSTSTREDVVVECPEWAPVAEMLSQLRSLVGVPGDAAAVVDGEPVGDTCAMQAMSAGPIRDGSVVNFAAPSASAGPTGAELRVVAGPAAGTAYQLRVGASAIGRGETAISINDPAISRRHATVVRSLGGFTVADDGSAH